MSEITNEEIGRLLRLQYQTIEERLRQPTASTTSKLLSDPNSLVKKIGEECAELVAAITKRNPENLLEELQQSAGWLPMVAAVSLGIMPNDYFRALTNSGGDYSAYRRQAQP